MNLPNLSYLKTVGELRYIQARFEKAGLQNPDFAVGAFLPLTTRMLCVLRGTLFLSRIRAAGFYHYINARTRYYDEVFLSAIRDSFKCIINVGCGSDTRAHRFADLIKGQGLTVLECDQEEAIRSKERLAKRTWPEDTVQYLPINLEDGHWPTLARFLQANADGRLLVMMEGVSPYVGEDSFRSFLQLLASELRAGSVVAYDFKLRGVADDFGRPPGTPKRFRLSGQWDEMASYHQALGLELQQVELGADLSRRLQPDLAMTFDEDCLLKLVARPKKG